MNVAQLMARCLENEGVEFIFGLPGEEIIHLVDALKRRIADVLSVDAVQLAGELLLRELVRPGAGGDEDKRQETQRYESSVCLHGQSPKGTNATTVRGFYQ